MTTKRPNRKSTKTSGESDKHLLLRSNKLLVTVKNYRILNLSSDNVLILLKKQSLLDSDVDPNPAGSLSFGWIRIHIHFNPI